VVAERILVLPRERVPGGTSFTGVRRADEPALAELAAAVRSHGFYEDRAAAEDDPRLKQLIPYVVVRDADHVFLMERTEAGGDARLHHKASIGVGGHLNPVDDGDDPLEAGLRREWAEELEADFTPEFRLVGFLNDDTNPVGSVHLGIVFVVDTAGRQVRVREHDKLRGRMVALPELRSAMDRMESWSRLVAEELLFPPA
jgi:predicted NUDIX family phosphoesterase